MRTICLLRPIEHPDDKKPNKKGSVPRARIELATHGSSGHVPSVLRIRSANAINTTHGYAQRQMVQQEGRRAGFSVFSVTTDKSGPLETAGSVGGTRTRLKVLPLGDSQTFALRERQGFAEVCWLLRPDLRHASRSVTPYSLTLGADGTEVRSRRGTVRLVEGRSLPLGAVDLLYARRSKGRPALKGRGTYLRRDAYRIDCRHK